MATQPERMHYVGLCRVCETGPLGVRRCGCDAMVLLCDECDAVWADAELDKPPQPVVDGALPCPACGVDLMARPSRWATREEIDRCDWLAAAIEEQGLELKECAAFAPHVNEPDGVSEG